MDPVYIQAAQGARAFGRASKEPTMNIASYGDLLSAAKAQPQPQRLLFVFTRAELPADAGQAEQERFAARQGGSLAPVMCVDKSPQDVASFADLVSESQTTGQDWDVVFVASMGGRNGRPPTQAEADEPIKMMVSAIKGGQVGGFLAFNREGDLLQLH